MKFINMFMLYKQKIILVGILLVYSFAFIVAIKSPDWELLTSKHYWKSEAWYYGGYASSFTLTASGYRPMYQESLVNYNNIFPFSESSGHEYALYKVSGWPSTERLLVPFLVYIITTLTWGNVSVWDAFFLLNISIWIGSILLMIKIVQQDGGSKVAAYIASTIVAFYPAYSIHFYGLKISYINTFVLLVGMYLYGKVANLKNSIIHLIYLSSLLFLSLFTPAGWVFLFVYFLIRSLNDSSKIKYKNIVILCISLIIGQLALRYLRSLYNLPRAEEQIGFSYSTVITDSLKWIYYVFKGYDVSNIKFINYIGYKLFTAYIPLIIKMFIAGHWHILAISFFGWIFEPKTRIYLIAFIVLFVAAHGGYAIVGWYIHYGYLSAPAAMMLIISSSHYLAGLYEKPRNIYKLLSLSLNLLILYTFCDHKSHAGYYYGTNRSIKPGYYEAKLYVHYGNDGDIIKN